MDKIILENMAFYGYHGVLPEEKALGQRFYLTAELYLPLQKAGRSDDLNDTVNYGAVYELIRTIVTGERFNLLEALAERVCTAVLTSNPLVQKIHLRIKKPSAPVAGVFDYAAVEIERDRT